MDATAARGTGIGVGDRLPKLRLPGAGTGSGAVRPLRGPHRHAVVVVALHDPGCDRCRAYLRTLGEERARFDVWDGTVLALTDADVAALQTELGDAVAVLVDADREVLDRIPGTGGDRPVTVVADRYGQVFHIEGAGRAPAEAGAGRSGRDAGAGDHRLMEPRELEEWLKYLATQCPE